jgi:hypothetical protein
MEFDPAKAKLTPEELVVSANLRRRHLTAGQIAAVAVDWAEKAEREGFPTDVSKTPGPQGGRPRSSALPEISAMLGTIEQRAREAKRIKEADPNLFAEVKAGIVSLAAALEKIKPAAEAEPPQPVSQTAPTESTVAAQDIRAGDQSEDDEPVVVPIFAPPSMAILPASDQAIAAAQPEGAHSRRMERC